VINAARQAGGVLGVALLGTLVTARASFAAGLQLGVALSTGAFLLGAVLTAVGVPGTTTTSSASCSLQAAGRRCLPSSLPRRAVLAGERRAGFAGAPRLIARQENSAAARHEPSTAGSADG
jgi:hypothetical protein